MNTITFTPANGLRTVFQRDGKLLWLNSLAGLPCGNAGQDGATPRTRGLALVATDTGRFEGGQFEVEKLDASADRLEVVWSLAGGAQRLESRWRLCRETGVWSRTDRFCNSSQQPVFLRRCLARFAFAPARYEIYFQESRWSYENQGFWEPVRAGARVLGCEWGRTTHNGTPYLCLRERESRRGVVFHVIPRGNWLIRVRADHGGGQDLPYVVVEIGLADEDLSLKLGPGETLELPEILVQECPDGDPRRAAPALHRYLNRRMPPVIKSNLPVVYNTWFDQFSTLTIPRLREQLRAVKELGCEVFVIDAGWFGVGGKGWGIIGDWREDTGRAFCGKMKEFADEVRAAGLGFGVWLELERSETKAPAYQAHPEWFRAHRLDLENPAAYAWLFGEVARLVETYKLAWIKIDMNMPSGYDATGAELYRYQTAWYRFLDEIRRRYPAVYLENCASGGMRHDLAALFHSDCHFVSDTVQPIDVLRISQGAWLRLPPGRLARWLVLRSLGRTVPHFDTPAPESDPSLATPGGATWVRAEKIPLDFAVQTVLPGVLGFSGDYIQFTPAELKRLRWYVDFYKQWRPMLAAATGFLLTPPEPIENRGGWLGFQMQAADESASLLFFYHLSDGCQRKRFAAQNLKPDVKYLVRRENPDGCSEQVLLGRDLMTDGLEVELDCGFHAEPAACVYAVRPA
jgi:alpha-galactosidase